MRMFTGLGVVVVAVAGFAAAATAATDNGVTALAPKDGATIRTGSHPVFRVRVDQADGAVRVNVCRSRTRDADGLICKRVATGRADRKPKRLAEYRPRPDGPAGAWLRTPGTYYWQAYRVDCAGTPDDCFREGPIRRVVVR